jgi:hypothetical protein
MVSTQVYRLTHQEIKSMRKITHFVLTALFVAGVSFGQTAVAADAPAAAPDCASKAVSKAGKPLAGAAKTAFIKKCEADAGGAVADDSGCAAKAVSKAGKPLAGAAKNSFMKKCEADAKAAK